jgi:hypothetical protein
MGIIVHEHKSREDKMMGCAESVIEENGFPVINWLVSCQSFLIQKGGLKGGKYDRKRTRRVF